MSYQALVDTDHVLNRRLPALRGPHVFETLERLAEDLERMRAEMPEERWTEFVERCRSGHPLLDRIRSGPVCGRSFDKPRGYAGDAETLDYIYGIDVDDSAWSDEVRDIHAWERRAPASRSVRARRDLLGGALDAMAAQRPGLKALSVACGHLREAQASRALTRGGIERLYALDQDEESLARVARDNPGDVVTPMQGSVRHLLARRLDLPPLDLIWSAGLYDYLEPGVARALTRRLFEMLAPGGRLLLVNFAPSLRDIGFMEAVMDWQLIYRDEGELRDLTTGITPREIAALEVHRVAEDNLVILDLTRSEDA